MARWPAELEFADGLILHAIHNMFCDTLLPRLYQTEEERSADWDRHAADSYVWPETDPQHDDETAILTIKWNETNATRWRVRASRRRAIILGPRSLPTPLPGDNASDVLVHEDQARYGI